MLSITFEDGEQWSGMGVFSERFAEEIKVRATHSPAVLVMAWNPERETILEKMPDLADVRGAGTLVLKDESARAFIERIDLLI